MSDLELAPGLVLPPDFATQAVAVVGARGSGKSNTQVRWAELLYGGGVPWTAIDPKGDWHGVRSSADGKAPGLSVPVFGGLHGDFPLEAGMGAAVADLLVDEMLSAVLDVSRFSKTGDLPRFLVAFFNRLMDRHQQDPHVRCVIAEEAHRYIPQQVDGGRAALKEAAAAVLLEGRSWGLGCWACTQRPARLNKDVLEEVSNLILHGLGVAATNDKKAVRDWTRHYDIGEEIVGSMSDLVPGEAWVISPQVLRVVRRVHIHRRQTFDTGATPTVGAGIRRPVTMADINAAAIKEALADSIERAEQDDPRALRRRIAALERELAQVRVEVPEPIVERVEIPVLNDHARGALEMLTEQLRRCTEATTAAVPAILGALGKFDGRPAVNPPAPTKPAPSPRPVRRMPPGPSSEGAHLGKAERAILSALAQHGDMATERIALLTGYAVKGGGFANALGALRSKGYITGRGVVSITADGQEAVGNWEPLPTGRALVDYWMGHSRLGHAEREILRVLVDAWPDPLTPDQVAAATVSSRGEPYEPKGGGFANAVGRLRTLGLVEGHGSLRANDDLAGP